MWTPPAGATCFLRPCARQKISREPRGYSVGKEAEEVWLKCLPGVIVWKPGSLKASEPQEPATVACHWLRYTSTGLDLRYACKTLLVLGSA
jgi:hypothetical protein